MLYLKLEESTNLTVRKNEKTQATILGGLATPFLGKSELVAQHLYFLHLFHRDDDLDFGEDLDLTLESKKIL